MARPKSLTITFQGKEFEITEGSTVKCSFNGFDDTVHIFNEPAKGFMQSLYEYFTSIPEYEVVRIDKIVTE